MPISLPPENRRPRAERELERLRYLALEAEGLLFDLEAHDLSLPETHAAKLQKIHLLITECRILRGDVDYNIDKQIAQAFVEGIDPGDES